MFGKRKTAEVSEQSAKTVEAGASSGNERILVLGAGCPKCRALEQTVVKALGELGVSERSAM